MAEDCVHQQQEISTKVEEAGAEERRAILSRWNIGMESISSSFCMMMGTGIKQLKNHDDHFLLELKCKLGSSDSLVGLNPRTRQINQWCSFFAKKKETDFKSEATEHVNSCSGRARADLAGPVANLGFEVRVDYQDIFFILQQFHKNSFIKCLTSILKSTIIRKLLKSSLHNEICITLVQTKLQYYSFSSSCLAF